MTPGISLRLNQSTNDWSKERLSFLDKRFQPIKRSFSVGSLKGGTLGTSDGSVPSPKKSNHSGEEKKQNSISMIKKLQQLIEDKESEAEIIKIKAKLNHLKNVKLDSLERPPKPASMPGKFKSKKK